MLHLAMSPENATCERAFSVSNGGGGGGGVPVSCMGIGSTVECSFATLALCFSLLAHPC